MPASIFVSFIDIHLSYVICTILSKKDAVLSMGHVSRPTLYKYPITKGHVHCSTDRGKYGNLMHQNYYRFRIQIISYANTGLYLY